MNFDGLDKEVEIHNCSLHQCLQAIDAEVERQRKLDDAKNSMKIISPSESSDESDDEESSTVKM